MEPQSSPASFVPVSSYIDTYGFSRQKCIHQILVSSKHPQLSHRFSFFGYTLPSFKLTEIKLSTKCTNVTQAPFAQNKSPAEHNLRIPRPKTPSYLGPAKITVRERWHKVRTRVIEKIAIKYNFSTKDLLFTREGHSVLRAEADHVLVDQSQPNMSKALLKASLYELSGDFDLAFQWLQKIDPTRNNENPQLMSELYPCAQYLHYILYQRNKQQAKLCDSRISLIADFSGPKTLPPHRYRKIVRKSALRMSYKEFQILHAHKNVPVVITDVPMPKWDFNHLVKELHTNNNMSTQVDVPVMSFEKTSVNWAGIEWQNETSIVDYIKRNIRSYKDNSDAQGKEHEQRWGSKHHPEQWHTDNNYDIDNGLDFVDSIEKQQVFDFSIPLNKHLWPLGRKLTISKYFTQNWFYELPSKFPYRKAWPSLFLSPNGSFSGLHVDFALTNFWMSVLHGHKRWRLVDRTQQHLLSPSYIDTLEPNFFYDLLPRHNQSSQDVVCDENSQTIVHGDYNGDNGGDVEGDVSDHESDHLVIWQADVRAGDTIFVPYGWPHQVENMEDTIAVAGNFVDVSNAESVIARLRWDSLVHPDAAYLLKYLSEMKQRFFNDRKTAIFEDVKVDDLPVQNLLR